MPGTWFYEVSLVGCSIGWAGVGRLQLASMARSDAQPGDPPTVGLVSLGCPKNLVDSEKMLGLLAEAGFAPVSYDPESDDAADVLVVNTCGFLEAAKEESLGVIREAVHAKREGRLGRVVVAGCLVQRHRARLLEWEPGIDALIGVFDRDRVADAAMGRKPDRSGPDDPACWIAGSAGVAAKQRGVALTSSGRPVEGYHEDDSARLRLTPRHYAYLRIGEGCSQNCAFCTIPAIRGTLRSKPLDHVIAEARELLLDGAFELNIIGQDTTNYGTDLDQSAGLAELLSALSAEVDAVAGTGWLRLMYAYPTNFDRAMVEAFAGLCERGRVVPYIDIPFQHASDRVLEAMRRRVSADQQRRLIEQLRQSVPELAIRTTLLTGFPGETEDDHDQLMAFVEESRFEAMGVFAYSPEPGTPGARMERDPALAVPEEVKQRRRDELMRLQRGIALTRAEAMVGRRVDVLVDGAVQTNAALANVPAGSAIHVGRTCFQAPEVDAATYVASRSPLVAGELVHCQVVASDGYDLIARPAEDLETRLKVL